MTTAKQTTPIEGLVERQRSWYASGVTRKVPVRLNALRRLSRALHEYEPQILDALTEDLGKPSFEGFLTELAMLHREIDYFLAHLEEWTKPQSAGRSIDTMMAKGEIIAEPLGVVLIIAPTNYPVQLALMPLIAAVGAGNTAIIRTSGDIPHINAALRQVIRRAFRSGHVDLVDGTEDPDNRLTDQAFGKILFTGSTSTGRRVMAQASQTLTPVILELGGKNPAIILRDADVVAAARKIAWGKFVNAGQTCIAPDHVYVHRQVRTAFIEELKLAIYEFYGQDPLTSDSYSRIGNRRLYDRLKGLLTNDLDIQAGGASSDAAMAIEPTVVEDVPADHPLMQEEIFGPILPVLEYRDINELIATLRSREKPLAAYVFGQNESFARKVLLRVPSGGGCVNETMLQVSAQAMPFGGVGHSGMGSYHGRYGFEAFSHMRSIVSAQPNLINSILYPPYSGWKEKLLRGFLTKRGN